jgi:hypothetical protein
VSFLLPYQLFHTLKHSPQSNHLTVILYYYNVLELVLESQTQEGIFVLKSFKFFSAEKTIHRILGYIDHKEEFL